MHARMNARRPYGALVLICFLLTLSGGCEQGNGVAISGFVHDFLLSLLAALAL